MVSTNYQGLLVSKVGNVFVDGYTAEIVRDIKEVKASKASAKTVSEKIKEKKAKAVKAEETKTEEVQTETVEA